MSARRLGPTGVAALAGALADPEVVARWAKVVQVPGSDCAWWTGAVSGRGHGRFWFGGGRVVVAYRFAFGLATRRGTSGRGAGARAPVRQPAVPADRAEARGRVVGGKNRREWVARRKLTGSPLADPRGARWRAKELRDMARCDPREVAADLERLRRLFSEQPGLW